MCVLIPAKDERLGIGETVSSVLAPGAPPKDVYVMDDGSSDRTGDIVMRDLLRQKFTYSILRRKLLSTFTASSCDSRLLIILFSRDRRPRNKFHAKHVLDRENSPLR
jgi:glycosyltransferase involved in cell wall biosynthesis